MAFLADSPSRSVQEVEGIHCPCQSAHCISGIVVAVVEYRTVRFETTRQSVAVLVSVVHPAGERSECPCLRFWVAHHQNAHQSSFQACIECVNIHAKHARCVFYFARSAKPFHGLLHFVEQLCLLQRLSHQIHGGVEQSHAIAQVVQCSHRTAGLKTLVEQMLCQANEHRAKRIRFCLPCLIVGYIFFRIPIRHGQVV